MEIGNSVRNPKVVVIGAGIAGLVAAVTLAARGVSVTLVERMQAPGGKMRQVAVGGRHLDAGPTVFTMRWVFDEIAAAAGSRLDDLVTLRACETLARHAWPDGGRLDLFADRRRAIEAIAEFAGAAEGRRYQAFCSQAARTFQVLDETFMQAAQPDVVALVRRSRMRDLRHIQPFLTLWRALGRYFHDQRLRQLFGRYATYCGSSPFHAPATLMLVAHVEQEGVWMVEGGMHRLARALADLAARHGAEIRYGAETTEIRVANGRANGVVLASGERLDADAVVATADVSAIAGGKFGTPAAGSLAAVPPEARSLSAVTWNLIGEPHGLELLRHTVFFSGDYRAEFDDILRRRRTPADPTVYICAQDRGDSDDPPPVGPERLLCLVNAPATGDRHTFSEAEMEQCTATMRATLATCGLSLDVQPETTVATTPADFDRLFPGTGGALYGRASHGWTASFRRPGCRTKLPGLYVAGGSAHPGPGVPMVALSGRIASTSLIEDLAST